MACSANNRNACHKHQAATMTTPEVSKTANKPPSCTVLSVYCFLAVARCSWFPPCTEGTVQHMPRLGLHAPLATGARLAPPTRAVVCTFPELPHAWPSSLTAYQVPEQTEK
jgi:hypothetical protein